MTTLEKLQAQYNELAKEELLLPSKIDDVLKSVEPEKERIIELERQAQEEDLRISEKPTIVYHKVCTSAFLGFGKTCHEEGGANPAVAREVLARNDIIREKNSLMDEINERLRVVSDYTDRQVEIEKEQIDIRAQILDMTKAITQEPTSVLGSLGRSIKSLFFKEEYEEATGVEVARPAIMKYIPYIAIGGGALVLFLLWRRRK